MRPPLKRDLSTEVRHYREGGSVAFTRSALAATLLCEFRCDGKAYLIPLLQKQSKNQTPRTHMSSSAHVIV